MHNFLFKRSKHIYASNIYLEAILASVQSLGSLFLGFLGETLFYNFLSTIIHKPVFKNAFFSCLFLYITHGIRHFYITASFFIYLIGMFLDQPQRCSLGLYYLCIHKTYLATTKLEQQICNALKFEEY